MTGERPFIIQIKDSGVSDDHLVIGASKVQTEYTRCTQHFSILGLELRDERCGGQMLGMANYGCLSVIQDERDSHFIVLT